MKGRVLLVNPWVYDFTAFDLWAKPLGLLYLGAHLKRRGWQVTLLDCMDRLDPGMTESRSGSRRLRESGCGGYAKEVVVKPPFFEGIPRFFSRFGLPLQYVREKLAFMEPPDLVLLTCGMTYWYPGAVLMGELVKTVFPSTPVWLGGVYPTLCPEHARGWGFDRVVTTVDPLQVLRQIGDLLGEDFGVGGYGDFFAVHPDFSLYPQLAYQVVLTSVGCPFHCSYCASKTLYPSFFHRSWEEVWGEICFGFETFGVQHFAFYDDALLFQAEGTFLPLLREVCQKCLPIFFHLPNGIHARYVTKELALLMCEAGFRTIRLSLETVFESSQKETGGKVNREDFERAVTYLREAGFTEKELEVYLLFGRPGSSEEEIRASVEYVRKMGLIPRLALYAPTPRTALYQTLPEFIRKEPLWHNKIAYLYAMGNAPLYEVLQQRGGEMVCR
ncbi:MAG: B12-binding domain-containing radical SAM protein [Atribacterota bacterium]